MKIKYKNIETGEIVQVYDLNPTQERFIKTITRFPLLSGGFGSGKTMAMCQKVLKHLDYPNNLGLLGRLTYPELRDSVQKTFFEVCPPNYIRRFNKAEQTATMMNGSELMLRHLDKIAEMEIRSMNLGFFAIDQAEEISEDVFLGLKGRLRRKVENREGQEPYVRQGMMTCNPALTWLFKYYKQNPTDEYELFESSTLDNKDNLPVDYIESLLKYPESWKRQYVYGVWDESLLADQAYFPIEYIQEQTIHARKPLRDFEGITIYQEVQFDDDYQLGVDPAGMGDDYSAIIVVSKLKGEVVASWKGKMPAAELSFQVAKIGRIYRNALAIVERNSIGLATITKLREIYHNIYKQETFGAPERKRIERYGWLTTFANKVLLLDNLLRLMREGRVRINDERTISEMKTFVWTDEVKKKGLGAQKEFHDDMVIATALGFWGIKSDIKSTEIATPTAPRNSVAGVLVQIQEAKSNDPFEIEQ
jgi:hypothetical protein